MAVNRGSLKNTDGMDLEDIGHALIGAEIPDEESKIDSESITKLKTFFNYVVNVLFIFCIIINIILFFVFS